MTQQEAIKHGKEQLEIFGGEHGEFIKLAIKALESHKVGKWIPTDIKEESYGYLSRCSICGMANYSDNYCPNCGAEMEE